MPAWLYGILCILSCLGSRALAADEFWRELDGGTYTVTSGTTAYSAVMHLGSTSPDGWALFRLAFVVGGRPYQCDATLLRGEAAIAGRTNHCVWTDSGENNPTLCHLHYLRTASEYRGTAYCSPAATYESRLTPRGL